MRQPPTGRGETLELNLAVRGGLEPRVRNGGWAVAFADAEGQTALIYAGLKVWDADGRTLDARLEVAGGGLRLELKAGGARYPLTIDPIVQQAYLKASNTDDQDLFGFSVAISGDAVVVGAPFEDSSATGVNGNQGDNSFSNTGAAYVFVRKGGVWSQHAYLKGSNTSDVDQFGRSVATCLCWQPRHSQETSCSKRLRPAARATFTWLGFLRPVLLGPVDKIPLDLVLQPVSTGFGGLTIRRDH